MVQKLKLYVKLLYRMLYSGLCINLQLLQVLVLVIVGIPKHLQILSNTKLLVKMLVLSLLEMISFFRSKLTSIVLVKHLLRVLRILKVS
jgi:hypothetical protein